MPTALGGPQRDELAPAGLRELGVVERMRARLGDAEIYDAGDLEDRAGLCADPDPRAKNAGRIAEFLPRERDAVHAAVGGNPDARLILKVTCRPTGAMAGLRGLAG